MAKQIEWSPTRIDAANYCIMRYYLKYIEKTPSLRPSFYLKGHLLHTIIKKFWDRYGDSSKVSRKGPKRYSDAEEFTEYAQRMWDYLCIRAENSQTPVSWSFEDERWVIRNKLEKICMNLFPILQEEEPPLFSELKFKFSLLGKIFQGEIDEIRIKDGKVIIRDYKSGRPYMGEMKLDFDPQLTIYNVAVNRMVSEDEEFARKLGLEIQRENSKEKYLYANPDFQEEFFMIEAPARLIEQKSQGKKTTLKTIHPTKRTDKHFLEIINMIDSVQDRVNNGNIVAERGRKCDFCDVKHACKKKLDEVGIGFMADRKGQFFLDFVVPAFAREEYTKSGGKRKKDPAQKRFHWKHSRVA